jgi:hypothetical protein
MMPGMERIGSALCELLRERKIIARCELLNRTYEFVRDAAPNSRELEELRGMVGERIAPGIFACIMNDSPILNLPKLDTYTQMNGIIFHFIHTQKYSKQDFDNAYRRFMTSLPELKVILRRNLRDLLVDFMDEAGYRLMEESPECLRFEAVENRINVLILTSIRSVDLNKCRSDEECIILTPSSENLDPFMQFFRQKGQAAEDAGVQIWVANMEKGTIDPFIGYTTDMDIYGQFKNPRMAEMVRTHWKK